MGFFSIELASVVESFVGVELDAPAIRAARQNMVTRGILNGAYVAGDTDQLLPSLLQRLDPTKTTVLLDPPRVGCRPPVWKCSVALGRAKSFTSPVILPLWRAI